MKTIFNFIITGLVLFAFSFGYAEELTIRHLGKINAVATNGYSSLELYYITNASTTGRVLGVYWIAKPNSHQAVATWSSNTVVDFGDKLVCFQSDPYELFIFPGITNVDDPTSEKQIRKFCAPIYEAVMSHRSFPHLKRISPDSLVPPNTFNTTPRDMWFHLQIIQASVTSSNAAFIVQGEKDKEALLMFDKELNVIKAEPIIKPADKRSDKTNDMPKLRLPSPEFRKKTA